MLPMLPMSAPERAVVPHMAILCTGDCDALCRRSRKAQVRTAPSPTLSSDKQNQLNETPSHLGTRPGHCGRGCPSPWPLLRRMPLTLASAAADAPHAVGCGMAVVASMSMA